MENKVTEIRQFGDHDLARLSLRERLYSLLRFGRVSLKEGEPMPRYDVKADIGKGVITRSDGTVLFQSSLTDLVESGKQVRFAIIAYKRILRERGILEHVRENRDLELVVSSLGGEVVLYGFDSRTKTSVQRYKLTREVSLGEIGVVLTALPKKLADAAALGQKVEAELFQRIEVARQAGDASKVEGLRKLGADLGIFRFAPVKKSPERKGNKKASS